MVHRKNLIKLIQTNSHRHDSWQVFSDFVEMSAISLSNAVDFAQREAREARYMEIIRRYDKEEATRFAQMLGELVMELEIAPGDVLGEVFMELELGNKWHGQFFTPYSVCKMMAMFQVDDRMKELVERRGFIRANEPACGGGAMMIALAESMKAAGINYQQQLHVVAQDLDLKAVCMAYVQLSLLHIPAVVIHGNTLALEERSHWYTPAHIMGGWGMKLRAAERRDAEAQQQPAPAQIVVERPVAPPAHDHIEEVLELVAPRSRTTETPQLSLF